jgi:hypothetical protein
MIEMTSCRARLSHTARNWPSLQITAAAFFSHYARSHVREAKRLPTLLEFAHARIRWQVRGLIGFGHRYAWLGERHNKQGGYCESPHVPLR